MQGLDASGFGATVRRVTGPCARCGAGGDVVVDRGGEEILEFVGGFEVEGGSRVIA